MLLTLSAQLEHEMVLQINHERAVAEAAFSHPRHLSRLGFAVGAHPTREGVMSGVNAHAGRSRHPCT
jgi:hypothetical protein